MDSALSVLLWGLLLPAGAAQLSVRVIKNMKWLQQHFKETDKFPRPDWDKIYEHVENDFKDQDQHELWSNIARAWIKKLKDKLPEEYTGYESENFILLTTENEKYVSLYLKFLERTLKKITRYSFR